MTQTAEPPRLRMTGVHKTFGPVVALDGAAIEVGPREVHGLLGGNGAGKTTLMNVLYGLYRADAGTVEIDGRPVSISSPRDAIAAGIGMVHQTFLQVDSYTVLENVVLGSDGLGTLRLDLRDAAERVAELSHRFGLKVDPASTVGELPVGVRQRVEILKALFRGCTLLVLDEPTTNLTPQEVDDLFESIRTMVSAGMSVILITHKIRETMSVCDRMTVMRHGSDVATVERRATTPEQLAATMVGEELPVRVGEPADEGVLAATGLLDERAPVAAGVPSAPARVEDVPAPALAANGLRVANDHGVDLIDGLDVTVAAGEILGIAGVAGNGQVELAEALAGVRQIRAGSVSLFGQDLAGRPTADWLHAGVAYVPEDRNRDGILPRRSITENMLLGSQGSREVKRRGLIDWRRARGRAEELIDTFSIMASSPSALAGDLSGGNVQRVILGRAFSRNPQFLILHNPTRGLDLRSTQFVYEQIRLATERGCGALLISEDLDEVIALSHRIMTLYGGRNTGEWVRGQADAYEIGRCMTGVEQAGRTNGGRHDD